jgi:hypothetical protein
MKKRYWKYLFRIFKNIQFRLNSEIQISLLSVEIAQERSPTLNSEIQISLLSVEIAQERSPTLNSSKNIFTYYILLMASVFGNNYNGVSVFSNTSYSVDTNKEIEKLKKDTVKITGDQSIAGKKTFTDEVNIKTLINSDNFQTSDQMIKYNNGNTTSDTLDSGIYSEYNDGSGVKYTGIVRRAGNGKFYLFKNNPNEPISSLDLNTNELANLKVGEPVDSNDVATKNYVTSHASGNYVDLTSDQSIAGVKTFTGDILVPNPPNQNDSASSLGYNESRYIVKATGGTSQTMENLLKVNDTLQAVNAPVDNIDVPNKLYLDNNYYDKTTSDNRYVNSSGDETITGTKTFTDILRYTNPAVFNTDVVNKKYADDNLLVRTITPDKTKGAVSGGVNLGQFWLGNPPGTIFLTADLKMPASIGSTDKHVIFETGGAGSGAGLFIYNNSLVLVNAVYDFQTGTLQGETKTIYDLSLDNSGILGETGVMGMEFINSDINNDGSNTGWVVKLYWNDTLLADSGAAVDTTSNEIGGLSDGGYLVGKDSIYNPYDPDFQSGNFSAFPNSGNQGPLKLYQNKLKTNIQDGNVDMKSFRVVNVADPVNAQDVATKNYVDSNAGGHITQYRKYESTTDTYPTAPAGVMTNVTSLDITSANFNVGTTGPYAIEVTYACRASGEFTAEFDLNVNELITNMIYPNQIYSRSEPTGTEHSATGSFKYIYTGGLDSLTIEFATRSDTGSDLTNSTSYIYATIHQISSI